MAWAPLSIIDAKKPEPKELRDWSWGSVTPLGTAKLVVVFAVPNGVTDPELQSLSSFGSGFLASMML